MNTNNRQFKFRIWDKISNKFIFPSFGYDIIGNSGDITKGIYYTHCLGLTWKEEIKDRHDIKNFIFQQFTGLKDKNGQEIYEGDILLDKNQIKTGIYYKVIFDRGWFIAEYTDKKGEKFRKDIAESEFLIMGNEYENPELV